MAKQEPLQTLRCDVSERDVANADKAAAKLREAKKAGVQPVQHQLSTLAQLAKLRAKKGTDLGVFTRNHKLTVTLDEDDEAVAISGRHGEIVRHPVYGLSLNFHVFVRLAPTATRAIPCWQCPSPHRAYKHRSEN